jgi:hypothetical protein
MFSKYAPAKAEVDVSVLQAASAEYEKRLQSVLWKPLKKYVNGMYNEVRGQASVFKTKLKEIPKWNESVIYDQADKMLNGVEKRVTRNLDKILKVIFVNRSLILASVRPEHLAHKPVDVSVPEREHFVHTVLAYMAEPLFRQPNLSKMEYRTLRHIARTAVSDAVEYLLPVDDILDTYIEDEEEFTTVDKKDDESGSEENENEDEDEETRKQTARETRRNTELNRGQAVGLSDDSSSGDEDDEGDDEDDSGQYDDSGQDDDSGEDTESESEESEDGDESEDDKKVKDVNADIDTKKEVETTIKVKPKKVKMKKKSVAAMVGFEDDDEDDKPKKEKLNPDEFQSSDDDESAVKLPKHSSRKKKFGKKK